jgi:hypothetical protein
MYCTYILSQTMVYLALALLSRSFHVVQFFIIIIQKEGNHPTEICIRYLPRIALLSIRYILYCNAERIYISTRTLHQTGTAGSTTFCFSGTGTGMHYGPVPDPVPDPDLDPDPT